MLFIDLLKTNETLNYYGKQREVFRTLMNSDEFVNNSYSTLSNSHRLNVNGLNFYRPSINSVFVDTF